MARQLLKAIPEGVSQFGSNGMSIVGPKLPGPVGQENGKRHPSKESVMRVSLKIAGLCGLGVMFLSGSGALAFPVDPTDPEPITDTWLLGGPAVDDAGCDVNCQPPHIHPSSDPDSQWLSDNNHLITVTGWEFNISQNAIGQVDVTHQDKGVGVKGLTGDTGQAKEMEDQVVDNNDNSIVEFTVIEFGNENWLPVSITLSFVDDKDDIMVYAGNIDPLSLDFDPQTNGFDDVLSLIMNRNISDDPSIKVADEFTMFFNDSPLAPIVPVRFLYIFPRFIDGDLPRNDNGGDSFTIVGLQGASESSLVDAPEPGTLGLLGLGLAGAGILMRRRSS